MTTARTIIKRALQLNGVLTKNESPTGDEASDGLSSLNNLIKSWSNDSLLIYARLSESFPFVSGTGSYTIGSGGDFNTARPTQILSAFTRVGGIDYKMSVINGEAYDKITQKGLNNFVPEAVFYDGNSPVGTLTFYPVPTTGTVYLRTEKVLSTFTTLDTDLDLPPGWDRALIYNLAMEIAPEYGQQVSQEVYQIATNALGKIKTAVARNKSMDMYPYKGGDNNIYTGWYS